MIFVTNDEKHILKNANKIWDICGLRCTKPIWALDYYRDFTKHQRPLQHFGNIDGEDAVLLSTEMREFITIIEKKRNIEIRPKVT